MVTTHTLMLVFCAACVYPPPVSETQGQGSPQFKGWFDAKTALCPLFLFWCSQLLLGDQPPYVC